MNRKSTSISDIHCFGNVSSNLDRSRPHRLVIIGIIKSFYTVFVGLKPLFESDKGFWYLGIIQMVFAKEMRASLESGNTVPFLIVVSTDLLNLILKLLIISI